MIQSRNVVQAILTLVHLSFQIVLASTAMWLEDLSDAYNLLYSPSLLTTNASSLVICTARCSTTVKCKAGTSNNGTEVCTCLDRKQSMVTRSGNRIWQRHTCNAQIDLYIRLLTDTTRAQADAVSFCRIIGAELAILDTDEQFNYVTGLHDFHCYFFTKARRLVAKC